MANPPLFLLFSIFALDALPATNTSYVVVTSDALIPGSELVIGLHLLDLTLSTSEEREKDDVECILHLSVTSEGHVWYRSEWEIDVDDKPKSFHKTLKVLVPLDENKLEEETSELKIESSSCFKFSHSVQVPVTRKDLLVSLRTDKSKYQPGEYVLIESLVLTHELRPHWNPVNLSIHNSRGDVLARWRNITAEEGLIRERYWIPLLAREDELTITLESHGQQVNHTVEIEVLSGPYGGDKEMFNVDIRFQRYHTIHTWDESKSPDLDINVAASHDSGVPLTGQVELSFFLLDESELKPMPLVKLEAGYKLISLKLEEVKEVLGLPKDESLVGRTVNVQVRVTEGRPSDTQDKKERKEEGREEGNKEEEKKDEDEKGESKVEGSSESEGNETEIERESEVERNETKEEKRESEDKGKEKHEDQEEDKGRLRYEVSVTRVVRVTFVDQSHVLFFSEFTPLYFKPGLTYVGQVLLKRVYEILSLQSGVPEVTVKAKIYDGTSDTPKEEVLTLKMESNWIGEFSFKLPENSKKLELEASFDDKESGKVVTAHLEELLPFSSEDGHYIQVLSQQKPPKVMFGETLQVKIESTFPTDEFLYEVFCQSLLVLSGTVSLPSPTTSHELSLLIPHNVSHLLSTPRLVVLALTPSNEIVSDSLRFVAEQENDQPLELELVSDKVQPGKTVELLVKAEPFTRVYLLAATDLLVFDSFGILLRELLALEHMLIYLRYLNSSQFIETLDELCDSCTTVPSLAPDSERVFNESLGLLLSDGLLHKDPSKPWPVPTRKNGTLDDLEFEDIQSVLRFEPRLWKLNVTVGSTGEEKLEFVVPEEDKLYTLGAFGLRPGKGLVVAEEPVQLQVTNNILADLRHPHYIVRGEELVLEVILFNNQEKDVEVEVILKEGPEFNISCLREEMSEGRVNLKLKAKETQAVPFYVKTSPTLQEPVEFELEIQSENVHIKLNTTLHVDYQGYVVRHSNSSVLNNFEGEQVLHIDLPKNITNPIEKSDDGHVKIYGHPLGPAIEHACRELDESCIVEERTKMWFVVAVNALEHIANNTLFDNSMDPEYDEEELNLNGSFGVSVDKDECIKSVRDALEYLLSKRNPDGSVSFYPTQPGFIWLTTLILDANLQLKNVRSLDVGEVVKTLEWLVGKQSGDGSFVEDEDVVSLRSDLDKLSHNVPLTSKVVASLLDALDKMENELPEKTSELIRTSTARAVEYILRKVLGDELNDDAYSLNVASYALAMAQNDEIVEILERRDRLVVDDDEEYPHWDVRLERPSERRSLSVEATAYGVLTYLAMNDLSGAGPFVEYLMSKMGPAGKFVTTEDTNVALRALSRYYRLLDIYNQHSQVNVEVNVTLSGKETVSFNVLSPLFVGDLYFVHSNISLSSPMTVESSGKGLVLVQSVAEYNKDEPSSRSTTLNLKLEVLTKDPEHLELKVCAENTDKEKTNFLIGEVPLLSGYELSVDQLERSRDFQVLKQDYYVYIMFNQVEPLTPKCVELLLTKLYQVGNLEPRFVTLYPVNDPELYVHESYFKEKGDKMESICPK